MQHNPHHQPDKKQAMHPLRFALTSVAFCFAATCHATPPDNADIDAFLRSYAFDVMQTLVNESLAIKVEAGDMTQAEADCTSKQIHLDDLLPTIRPIVTASFPDKAPLLDATAYFDSATGIKTKAFGSEILRAYMRAKALNQPAPPRPAIPASFTMQDMQVSAGFNASQAGRLFERFVNDGLPQMRRVDLLSPALKACMRPVQP
jgi:hypothetical protein